MQHCVSTHDRDCPCGRRGVFIAAERPRSALACVLIIQAMAATLTKVQRSMVSRFLIQRVFTGLSLFSIGMAGLAAPTSTSALDAWGCVSTGFEVPPQAGMINVKDQPYLAVGDGVHDDTAAIKAAIAAAGPDDTGTMIGLDRAVYFPPGTYLVSDTLDKHFTTGNNAGQPAAELILIGASRCTTTIKLADNAAGFGDVNARKPVVRTYSKRLNQSNPGSYPPGDGNDAYHNSILHLTIEVGTGNPGAVGVAYLVNNIGSMRDVTVRASGPAAVGIDLTRQVPGPGLITDVRVEGFDVGISAARTSYSMTLEHVTLIGQRVTGLLNDSNMLSVHDLTVLTPAGSTAIENVTSSGLITMQDATLTAIGFGAQAIRNNGHLALEGVRVLGFWGSVLGQLTWQPLEGTFVGDTRSGDFASKFSLTPASTPEPGLGASSQWVDVTAYGAVPDETRYIGVENLPTVAPEAYGASTQAIQAALDAAAANGQPTVFLPKGIYYVANLSVPAGVHTILGFGSTLRPVNWPKLHGLLRVQTDSQLVIDNLTIENGNLGGQVSVEHEGPGTLVLRDVRSNGSLLLWRTEAGGPAFLSNTAGAIQVFGPAPVYARQLNIEGAMRDITTGLPGLGTGDPSFIINDGAPLWILGIKTERPYLAVNNRNAATTEIVGGLFYMVNPPGWTLLFRNTDSTLSASFIEEAFNPQNRYTTYLESTSNGMTTTIPASDFPERSNAGRVVPVISTLP